MSRGALPVSTAEDGEDDVEKFEDISDGEEERQQRDGEGGQEAPKAGPSNSSDEEEESDFEMDSDWEEGLKVSASFLVPFSSCALPPRTLATTPSGPDESGSDAAGSEQRTPANGWETDSSRNFRRREVQQRLGGRGRLLGALPQRALHGRRR